MAVLSEQASTSHQHCLFGKLPITNRYNLPCTPLHVNTPSYLNLVWDDANSMCVEPIHLWRWIGNKPELSLLFIHRITIKSHTVYLHQQQHCRNFRVQATYMYYTCCICCTYHNTNNGYYNLQSVIITSLHMLYAVQCDHQNKLEHINHLISLVPRPLVVICRGAWIQRPGDEASI